MRDWQGIVEPSGSHSQTLSTYSLNLFVYLGATGQIVSYTEVAVRYAAYRFIHRFLSPVLPDSRLTTYFLWKSALSLVGTEFHRENQRKNRAKLAPLFDINMPLQAELLRLLPKTADKPYRILDVGSGPVSKVGKMIDGQCVDLVPVDPLADDYARLLGDLGLRPPFSTRKGFGERLTRQFPEKSFDLIHARNSIDHCLDPLSVIREAIGVLKPGCSFYLNHYRNEGIAANYYGLHQWNLDERNGEFVISNRSGKGISVNSALQDVASISSVEIEGDRIIVVIQKADQ